MSSESVYEAGLRALERYGFGIVLASSVLWFVRIDIVLPMVESHRQFINEKSGTQRQISAAVAEHTRLLYALQPAHQHNGSANKP
jgi:hypothetical protein